MTLHILYYTLKIDMQDTLWADLQQYYDETLKGTHLKELLADEKRNAMMIGQFQDIIFDYTHEKLDFKGKELLKKLAEDAKLFKKIQAQFKGVPIDTIQDKINKTENRSVLHTALRLPKGATL